MVVATTHSSGMVALMHLRLARPDDAMPCNAALNKQNWLRFSVRNDGAKEVHKGQEEAWAYVSHASIKVENQECHAL